MDLKAYQEQVAKLTYDITEYSMTASLINDSLENFLNEFSDQATKIFSDLDDSNEQLSAFELLKPVVDRINESLLSSFDVQSQKLADIDKQIESLLDFNVTQEILQDVSIDCGEELDGLHSVLESFQQQLTYNQRLREITKNGLTPIMEVISELAFSVIDLYQTCQRYEKLEVLFNIKLKYQVETIETVIEVSRANQLNEYDEVDEDDDMAEYERENAEEEAEEERHYANLASIKEDEVEVDEDFFYNHTDEEFDAELQQFVDDQARYQAEQRERILRYNMYLDNDRLLF